jgi:hypothetical protein
MRRRIGDFRANRSTKPGAWLFQTPCGVTQLTRTPRSAQCAPRYFVSMMTPPLEAE